MKRRTGAALALIAALVAAPVSVPVSAQISVIDDFGRTVTLLKPAQRILSLSPHNTENLFSAGAGDKIVGVSEHSDYPPQAQGIPSVGGSYASINLEAVIDLAPDLVVAWETAGNRASLGKIAQLGFPVYYSEPRNFADIIENIEELALLAASAERMNPPAAELRAELARLRERYANEAVQTVFYQISATPLMTLNGEHALSRALELCGARNAFAHLPIIAPQVGVESVLQANPDIIVIGARDGGGGGGAADVALWRKWTSLKAVQGDGFVFVDADSMHRNTARMILGIGELCEGIDRVRRAHDGVGNLAAQSGDE